MGFRFLGICFLIKTNTPQCSRELPRCVFQPALERRPVRAETGKGERHRYATCSATHFLNHVSCLPVQEDMASFDPPELGEGLGCRAERCGGEEEDRGAHQAGQGGAASAGAGGNAGTSCGVDVWDVGFLEACRCVGVGTCLGMVLQPHPCVDCTTTAAVSSVSSAYSGSPAREILVLATQPAAFPSYDCIRVYRYWQLATYEYRYYTSSLCSAVDSTSLQ